MSGSYIVVSIHTVSFPRGDNFSVKGTENAHQEINYKQSNLGIAMASFHLYEEF